MAQTAQEEFEPFGFESELLRERAEGRFMAKLIAICAAGTFVALSVAVVSGYQVIMSDPATASRFGGIGTTLQAFVPFADEDDATTVAGDEDLAKIAPAAGPTE